MIFTTLLLIAIITGSWFRCFLQVEGEIAVQIHGGALGPFRRRIVIDVNDPTLDDGRALGRFRRASFAILLLIRRIVIGVGDTPSIVGPLDCYWFG